MWNKFRYWFPRLIIISFAVSIVVPAPEFISSMENAEFLVWLLRLIWVLAFPTGFTILLVLTRLVKKIQKNG